MPPSIDFQRVFESGPGLFLLLDPKLHILAASDAYLRATLTQRDAILGRYVFDVFPDNPDDPATLGVRTVRASMERAIHTKAPDTLPVQKYDVPRPESEGGGFAVRYWSPVNSPILGPTGEVLYLLHRVEEVTDFVKSTLPQAPSASSVVGDDTPAVSSAGQTAGGLDVEMYFRAQEISTALREAETRFQVLVEGVRDYSIVMLDPRGVVVSWNQGAERIKGYLAVEILGQPVDRFYLPEDREAGLPASILRAALDTGRHEEDGTRVRRDGTPFPALVTTTALIAPSGAHLGFAQVTRDLTETRQLEAQLQQKQRLEAIGQLAGGVAHDFNNLVTVIASNVEFSLEEVPAGSPVREYLSEIEGASNRATDLTRQLLAFSRRQVITPKVIDLNEVATGMDKMVRRLIGEDIRCEFRLAKGLGRVRADRGQIEQIIMNLAANARDAMPTGGTFTIETENVDLDDDYVRRHVSVEPGPHVMLVARDTGVGMSRETLDHIFEPFFTTKKVGQGTGLGLATVWGIVKQNGGAVWAYSELGRGSTFKVYLPRVDAAVDVEQPGSRRKKDASSGTETIVLLDDDQAIRTAAVRALTRQGYTVIEASSGPEAVSLAATHKGRIDLLVTDVVMPGASGPQVAAEFARLWPNVKVIYMSGYTANVVAQQTLQAGATFLEKPFAPTTFLAKVRTVLDA